MAIDLQHAQGNLRLILNEWDPIGVAELVDDEYDCLITPLLSKLLAGAGRTTLSEFLRHEIVDHFGLDPRHIDIDSVADRLVAWWAAYVTADM